MPEPRGPLCATCRDAYAPVDAFVCVRCRARADTLAEKHRQYRKQYYAENAEWLREQRRINGYIERRSAGIPTREESLAERDATILDLADRLARIPKIREIAEEVRTSYQSAAVRRRRIFMLSYRRGEPAARDVSQDADEPGVCEFCGEPYMAVRHFPLQRFCSPRCRERARLDRKRNRKRETHVQH